MDAAQVDGTTGMDMVQGTSITIQLPKHEPALYGLQLEIKDVANNVRQARRFVLYDKSSKISVNSTSWLYVSSAEVNTNYTWQISRSDACITWTDRYYNDKYVHFNPLRPIEADSHGLITTAYDQTTGPIPVSGTTNVHGITNFEYSLTKELNGQNITVSMDSIPDVTSQSVCISSDFQDGDTYIFTIQAYDIVRNEFLEYILFSIDSSPPVISNAGLVRDGHEELFVHNSTELFKMTLEFDAYDTHSGLIQVLWKFYENNPERLIGQGAEGVQHTETKVCTDVLYITFIFVMKSRMCIPILT